MTWNFPLLVIYHHKGILCYMSLDLEFPSVGARLMVFPAMSLDLPLLEPSDH